MKRTFLLAICLFVISVATYAQDSTSNSSVNSTEKFSKTCLTVGILNGGGSLLGVDLETLVSERIGIQGGCGLVGYDFGLNYHLKPGIRSSLISLSYWHQGIGSTFYQSLVGPSYIFRAKKYFTAQIGLGYILEKGPAYTSTSTVNTPVILTYSIGLCFPLQ